MLRETLAPLGTGEGASVDHSGYSLPLIGAISLEGADPLHADAPAVVPDGERVVGGPARLIRE